MHVQMERRAGAPAKREANVLHALILLSTVICGTLAPTVIGPVLPAMQQHFSDVPGIETLVPVVVTMPMLVLGALAMVIGAVSECWSARWCSMPSQAPRRFISTRSRQFSRAARWSVWRKPQR